MTEYDVFISYRWVSPDQEWVRDALFPALKAAGLRPCLDVEDFVPGRDIMLEMARAGGSSRHALCVISPDYVSDDRMVTFEALNARRSDPSGRHSKLVPLLLRHAELPEWIRGLVPVNWTDSRVHGREWSKLLRVLNAPRLDAPPPPAVDQPTGLHGTATTVQSGKPTGRHPADDTPTDQARPAAVWRPSLILMKVNPRVVTPYAINAAALVVASAVALGVPGLWQRLPFLMNHVDGDALSHATPMLWQTLVCSLFGIALLTPIMTGLLNMQIMFSAVKMFFLLAFFSFLCAVVTLISYRSMIPHMVLALLLIAAFTKHFVLGSLGYYWKRRSFFDTTAEAVLLIVFVALMAGPLQALF